MVKRIAILGSTGSVGRSALRVIDALGPGFRVRALTAHSNFRLLAQQVHRYKPAVVAITDPDYYSQLRAALAGRRVKILAGLDGLTEIAGLEEVDVVITAVVGAAGLPALLAAAEKAKVLAIANKEPLVIAGELLTRVARRAGATILPIDSEHSAILQCMQSALPEEVSGIILTASGGPFRTASARQIQNATIEDALAHPTWRMGPKITVDSATMMNKALEIIEARWLFNMPVEKIKVLIHPESIVHSLVEFVDGAIMALLARADMRLPIQYALTYPHRVKGAAKHLRLSEMGSLTFEKPNLKTFRALALGYEVARIGGSAAVVFNAANEAAVKEFLAGNIKFAMIVNLIEHCLDKHRFKACLSLPELLEMDKWARQEVAQCLKQKIHRM
jgi:1-deoxy-D-xylulose-5-phosphate reductoisomerase